MVVGYITTNAISAYHHKRSNPAQVRCTRYNIIHLFTGYEGNNTFIVPKVPTSVRGNAEYNSWYRGDNKSDITRIDLNILTDITGGNSHAVDFSMQYQNYCYVFIKEKR